MDATTATPSRTTTRTRAFPLAAYFILAYALTWLILVPAGLGLLPDSSAGVLSNLAPFGPAVAAFIVTALIGGRPAVGQLLRRLVQWRVGVGWYLLVLFGIPLITLLGAFAVLGSVPLDGLAQNWPLIFTGYLPNVLFGGWTGLSFSLWLAATIASAFVYTWVFNNTGGSVLLAMLLHAAINKSTGLTMMLVPGLEDAFNMQLYGAIALAFTVAAVVLATATRGRLGYRAQKEPLGASPRS